MTVCLTSYVKTNNNGQGYFYHKSYYILSRAVVHVLVVLVYGISICLIIPFAFLRARQDFPEDILGQCILVRRQGRMAGRQRKLVRNR